MKRALVAVVAACSASALPPSNRVDVPEGAIAIEDVPRVERDRQPLPAGAQRDCRLGTLVRTRFHGQSVRPCGSLALTASSLLPGAQACLASALAHDEPFIVEQEVDRADISALVGIRENGRLAVYKLYFTGDDEPGTHVERCRVRVTQKESIDCPTMLGVCLQCDAWEEIDDCRFVPHRIHPPG